MRALNLDEMASPSLELAAAAPPSPRIYRTGDEYFPALMAAIDRAKDEVLFEVYIFNDDVVGHALGDALKRPAARGVRVHVLIDGWGSYKLPRSFVEDLQAAGVEVLVFQPLGKFFLTLKRSVLRRLHRKVAIIDGRLAFVGGINVWDPQITRPGSKALFDYAISIEGPLVENIRANTLSLWRVVSRRGTYPKSLVMNTVPRHAPARDPREGVAFVSRDNLKNRRSIEQAYVKAIEHSNNEIIIASAYFFPSRKLRRALVGASRRGVRVRLLLQGLEDIWLMKCAAKALYGYFIREGIEIYEDVEAIVHAKVAVFDRKLITIGSSNLDPVSLGFALEANIFLEHEKLGGELHGQLSQEIEQACERIDSGQITKRSFSSKLAAWACFGAVQLFSAVFLEEYGAL